MAKFFVGPVALVIAMLPAIAVAQKTTPDSPSTQSVQPTSPNSGAGIPGHPGNKSGPSAKKPETTGSDATGKRTSGLLAQPATTLPTPARFRPLGPPMFDSPRKAS